MMRIIKVGGIVLLAVLAVSLVTLRTFGYEPRDESPGLRVTGEVMTEPVTSWSFTDDFREIVVQTRSRYLIPHSVTTYCVVYDGNLYLFSAYYQGGTFPDARAWNRNVVRDPRVRLKIDGRL